MPAVEPLYKVAPKPPPTKKWLSESAEMKKPLE
jgi:hypothetical protein